MGFAAGAQFHRRMRSPRRRHESHMWRCYTFYDTVWKESREYVRASQITKLSSIGGFIIGKVRHLHARENEIESDQLGK